MDKGSAIVSIAGPISNFILAILFAILFHALSINGVFTGGEEWQWMLRAIISSCVFVNIGIGIFNLIPIPPLDGSKILMMFLPYQGKQWFYNNERYLLIGFILLWVTGVLGRIIMPVILAIASGLDWVVVNLFGLFL